MKLPLSPRHAEAMEQILKAAERAESFYHRGAFKAARGRHDIWDPWCRKLKEIKPTILALCLEICVKGTSPESIASRLNLPLTVILKAFRIGLEEWAKYADRLKEDDAAA